MWCFFCFFLASFLTLFFKNSSVSCMFIRLWVQYCVCACKTATRKLFPVAGSYGNPLKDSQCKNKSRLQGFDVSAEGGDVTGAATCAPAFCHRTGASACRSEWRRRPTWPAGWRRTRRRPATGCPPGGSGPWPRRPAGPPGTGGSSPSSGAPGPSAPGTVNRNRTRCLKSDTCCRPRSPPHSSSSPW